MLDATTVTVTVNGVAKVEGVDFTVNRTTGVVTFSVAPASGTNNVIITAYKTDQADIDSILNCLSVQAFGGRMTIDYSSATTERDFITGQVFQS